MEWNGKLSPNLVGGVGVGWLDEAMMLVTRQVHG